MAENITIFPTGLTYSRNTKAPLMDMQVFETLALAQAYVDNKDQTAYVGLTVSVVGDGDNNGLYYVERIADANNATGLLVKVGSDSAAEIAAVKADVTTLKTTVGDSTSGLVADVAKNAADIKANSEEIAKKANVFTVGNGLVLADNKIDVVVSTAEGNSLSVDANGLYVSVPEITVPEYSLDSVESPADAYAAQYEFKKDGVVLNTINIPKDQFLKEASYDADADELVFVFNTAAGENTTRVNVADLVDTYTAGSYITITDNAIAVDYDSLKAKLDTDLVAPVSAAVLAVDGRMTIAEEKITTLETASADYVSRIGVLETAKGDHETRIATLEGVQHPTLEQVTTLETNYNTLNTNVTNIQTAVTDIKVKDVDSTESHGVALKLDTAGKIGVTVNIDTIADAVIEKHVVSVSAADIALSENIGTEENPDRYTTSDSVQGVLSSLNARIESIDADIQSALDGGVTGIEAMNGIVVDATTATKPKVGVKIATGSALSATADGLDLVWEELA
jgi:hypothetical protein